MSKIGKLIIGGLVAFGLAAVVVATVQGGQGNGDKSVTTRDSTAIADVGTPPTEDYPPSDRILGTRMSDPFTYVDFLVNEDGSALQEARRCARSLEEVEGVICNAFASREAYQASEPKQPGDFEAAPCYEAHWTRYPSGDEDQLDLDPVRKSNCPGAEGGSEGTGTVYNRTPAREQQAPWSVPGGALNLAPNDVTVRNSSMVLASKQGPRWQFDWEVVVDNHTSDRRCVVASVTLIGQGDDLASASKWRWVPANGVRTVRGREGVSPRYAGPAVRYEADATMVRGGKTQLCDTRF